MELYALKTWYDRHHGIVEVEEDVLNIVQQIKAIDSRIHVFYNEQTEKYDLVEHCLDGVQRLVFSVRELDARVIRRLHEADHWGGNATPDRYIRPDEEDFASIMDRDNKQLERELEERTRDRLGDAGERLAWALDAAGVGMKDSILITKDLSGRNSQPSEPDIGHSANDSDG